MFRRGSLRVPELDLPEVGGSAMPGVAAPAGGAVAQDDMEFLKGLWEQPSQAARPEREGPASKPEPIPVMSQAPTPATPEKPIISEDEIQLPDLSAITGRKPAKSRSAPRPAKAETQAPKISPLEDIAKPVERSAPAVEAAKPTPLEPPSEPTTEDKPKFRRSIAADEIFRVGISRDELAAGRITADNLFEEGLTLDRAGKAVVKPRSDELELPPSAPATQEQDSGFEFDTIDLNSLRETKAKKRPEPEIPLIDAVEAVKPKKQKPEVQVAAPFTDEEERSLAEVHYNIGLMFANGDGVPKNETMAAKWFLKAAEEGLPEAQYNIGEMYLTGTGVEKNPGLGMQWIQKAAANGYKPASEALSKRSQA